MTLSLAPRLSAYDPAAEGEGSLDPLGLEAIAERLAEQLLPGMTARMNRVRMLTFMAVSSHVIEPYVDEYTQDQTTPAFLVFEWMYAEAMAREGLTSTLLPGIQRAHKIRNGDGRLAGRTYLKSPGALGIHGFYRRLARATRIVDDSQALGENGESLLRAWEKDRELDGFLDGEADGGKALRAMRRELELGLRSSHSQLREQSAGGLALRWALRPDFPERRTRRERRELRRILEEDERRRESFSLLGRGLEEGRFDGSDEAEMAAWIAKRGSATVAASARALVAYERVATLLSEAFEALLWSSSQSGMRPRQPARLVQARHGEIARELPAAIATLSRASDGVDLDQPRSDLIADFEEVRGAAGLATALLKRHDAVQDSKGRQGKLPWFERTERGVVVRPDYVRDQPPEPYDGFMHPVRLTNTCHFLAELG